MAIWGADVDQLRELGNKLEHGASEIDSQRNRLNTALENTHWEGPDADRFKEQWRGEHTSKLKQISEALRDASNRAKQNADQQTQASQN